MQDSDSAIVLMDTIMSIFNDMMLPVSSLALFYFPTQSK